MLVEGKGGRAGHKQVHNSHNQPALINIIVSSSTPASPSFYRANTVQYQNTYSYKLT